jgi:hypothetical protein
MKVKLGKARGKRKESVGTFSEGKSLPQAAPGRRAFLWE